MTRKTEIAVVAKNIPEITMYLTLAFILATSVLLPEVARTSQSYLFLVKIQLIIDQINVYSIALLIFSGQYLTG